LPKYCKNCGTENNDNTTFCRNCGEKLSKINTPNSDNNIMNNQKILSGAIVALLIVIAIIGTYAFLSLNNNVNNSDATM